MKKIIGLIIVLILSIPMIRPLVTGGYFPMHDDTQIARVVTMGKALRDGQFPVRWVSDLGYGYGYPIYNFYAPLPYYVGGFFYALGIDGLTATKLMMGIGLVAAGFAMYVVMANLVGISGGILSAALYMYAPYHAVQAYIRGSVGEYYALIFLPVILFGLWRKKILVASVGIAGLILSHTILGYIGMLLVGIAALVIRRRFAWISVLLGLGMSAFFWLPAITEMHYTNVSSVVNLTAQVKDHFVCLPQLWNSQWGYGGSAPGCLDGLSFKLGKVHLGMALLGVAAFSGVLAIAGLLIVLVSVFMMLPVSAGVWNVVPLFSYVQYPWRFLAFAIFGLSLMAGFSVIVFRRKLVRWVFVIFSIALVLFVEGKRFSPQEVIMQPSGFYESPDDIQGRVSKISDEYLPPELIRPTAAFETPRELISPSDSYVVTVLENKTTYKKIAFQANGNQDIRINVAHFPGWHYIVNVDNVLPQLDQGLPVIPVLSGESVVQMYFSNTPVRTLANGISIGAVALWIYFYDKRKKTIG